jgi:tetratricopeptide (TPR) repeat protein
VLELLRRQSLAALGSPVPQSPLPPIRSDWERFTLGRLYLRAGELAQAEPYLEAALASLRHGFWPNYYAGIVRYRAGNFTGALACFSVCIGAAPTEPSAYYNRALTFAALHEPRRARADYDRVRELDADFANTLRPLP